jgi:enoyl-CoA hydratase/carnithine racemase
VAPLEITEQDGVISVRVTQPSPAAATTSRVAERLLDLCTEIRERLDISSALVLVSKGTAFVVEPPTGSVECNQAAEVWREAIEALAGLPIPTIAGLAGDAIGPAWELALACDLRLAEDHVSLGSPEISYGCMPSCGGTQRLPRLIGSSRAAEMLLLGEILPAGVARKRGLIQTVVGRGEIDVALDSLLGPLRQAAPLALAYAKEAVLRSQDLPLAGGLHLEADLAVLLQTTRDRAEGISAFLERRTPSFEGR